jgi:hypothetical protein
MTFLKGDGSKTISLCEDTYMSQTLDKSSNSPASLPPVSIGRRFARNSLVFALGIVLLELSYGTTLLEQAIDSELDVQKSEKPNTESLVAARLVKDIRGHEPDSYALAAKCCIECDMGYDKAYSLDDDTFRSGFIDRVVLPLKADYDEVFS